MIKLSILLSVLNFSPIQDADTSTLSIQEAISIALEKNYDIKIEGNFLEIAENNNSLGNAGFLPTLEADGSINKSIRDTDQTLDFGDGDVTRSQNGAKTSNKSLGVNLEWTLFDGLKMFASKNRLQETAFMSDQLYKATVQNTITEVLIAFYNTALEQERLVLLNSTLQLSEERMAISKHRYDVGKASKLEYLQAQVDLNADKSALVRQQERITTTKYALWQILGLETDATEVTLVYEYEIDRFLNLEELISLTLSQNPELMAMRSQREVALYQIKEEERTLLPSIDLNLGYAYDETSSEVGVLRNNQALGFNYGLSANFIIFDGLNQNRVIQNAKIQAETASFDYERSRTQLITTVRSEFLKYQNSLELVALEQENLDVAQENEDIALERYKVGRSNPLEIREAQNNSVSAQIRYLEALLDAKISEIQLMRLSGQILE